MAASCQISQNKRGRDEYFNSGLGSPESKRTNRGTLGNGCNRMPLLDRIDSVANNNSNPEDIRTATNDVEGEMRLNVVINSVEDQIGLKARTYNNIESSDQKSSTEQMGSNKEGELTADRDSEATSVTFDIRDFPYYDDICGELGFFVDHFTPDELGILPDELGILQNHIYGDSTPDIMYPDAVHGYVETTELFYGSLWEDDIWH